MDKHLFIIRGLPGSGKSYLASLIADLNVAADDYFDIYNGGEFDPNYLWDAHSWCRTKVRDWMAGGGSKIAVHNTFTREWEFEEYVEFARMYGYTVHTIVVENRHESESVHDVPAETVERMRDRFEIKL